MKIQAKLLCAVAVSGFAAFAAIRAGAGADRAGMQREISGRQDRRARSAARSGTTSARPNAAPTPRPPRPPLLPAAAAPAPAAPKEAKKEAAPAAAPALPAGPAVYPNAVDPKYAKESAGKARMHTCVDQYNANKATNGNGGLKWIQKGGGYYSECTKKLKGAA